MEYREIKPIGFLTNSIQSFWEYETFSTEFEHTVTPNGYFDLIVGFENNSFRQIRLAGVWIMSTNVIISKSTKFFGIRFELLTAGYAFQREIKSTLNTNVVLHNTLQNISSYQTNDFEMFVPEISSYSENSIKHFKEIDNRKLKLSELVHQRQNLSVEELSKSVFWSSRQINRYFNRMFGSSSKLFLDIICCSVSYKDTSEGILYPGENYSDQAHFTKEIKKYTEKTPKELPENENVRFL